MDALAALFERFRRHADAAALGEVFDRTAPRLLALALHLCGDEAAAEDAVQQAFLQAMRHADQFEGTRPLLPWLLGLLGNAVRNQRRHEAQRRAEPLPELASDDGGPLAAAERRELVAALRQQVDALPDEQRQVLLLRLQHGLSAVQIAEVVGAAPGAVRMRLHRGLAALRRLLPAAFAAWCFGALPGRGLAAVRHSVVAAARQHVAAAAAGAGVGGGVAAIGGVLAMKKLLLGCAAVAMVAALWWWGLPASASPPRPASGPTHPAAAVADGDGVDRRGDAAPVAAQRQPVADAPAALRVRVASRVGDEVLPMGGAVVAIWAGDSELVPFIGEALRLRTDARGEIALGEVAAGTWHAQVLADPAGRSHAVAARSGDEALLAIELPAQRIVRGIVVDSDGVPVADAEVWVYRGTSMGRYSMPEPGDIGARCAAQSGPDGRFTAAITAREGTLGASRDGYGESYGRSPGGEDELRLVLGRTFASVAGVVRDADAAPVAGALVMLRPAGQDRRRTADGLLLEPRVERHAYTDREGRYRFAGTAPGNVRVWATAWPRNPAWTETELVAFQDATIDLQLKRGVGVVGTVRHADGSPARAHLYSTPERDLNGHYCECETREDGSFELYYQPHRSFFVVLGHHRAPVQVREFASPEPGVLRCDFVLGDKVGLRGRVVDDRGEPLAGWNVLASSHDGFRAWQRTDTGGNFLIGVPIDRSGRLVAYPFGGSEQAPAVQVDGVVPGGEAIELCVPAAAMPRAGVHGRLVNPRGAPIADIGLTVVEATPRDGEPERSTRTGTDGRFAFDAMVAGSYRLQLVGEDEGRQVAKLDLATAQVLDLGDLALEPAAVLQVGFTRADGSVWRGDLPWLALTDATGGRSWYRHERIAGGIRLRTAGGRYRIEVRGDDLLAEPQTVDIAAGERRELKFTVGIGRSRKLVFNGDGQNKPAYGTPLQVVVCDDAGKELERREVTTLYPDLRGFRYWYFDRTWPFGRYRVEAHTDTGLRYRGEFAVGDDLDEPTRVDVPLVAQ